MLNNGVPVGTFTQEVRGFGGGGYCPNFARASSGRKLLGCDVQMPQIRDAGDTEWRYAFTIEHITALGSPSIYDSYVTYAGGYIATYTVAISESNPDVFLIGVAGRILITQDGGDTFSYINLSAKLMHPNNGVARLCNYKARFHPSSPGTFIFGTDVDGAYYSTNYGATVTHVSGITGTGTFDGLNLPTLVEIDQGNANYVYIADQGVGIKRSTTGVGGTFTLITGSPTRVGTMKVSADGTLWVAGIGANTAAARSLKKIARGSGSSWTDITPTTVGASVLGFALDPADAAHAFVWAYNVNYYQQTWDAGSTWGIDHAGSPANADIIGQEVPWHGDESVIFMGETEFDTYAGNLGKLCAAHGIGYAETTLPGNGVSTQLVWHDKSKGNETLGVTNIASVPGIDRPFYTVGDKCIMWPRHRRAIDAYPTHMGPNGAYPAYYALEHGWNIDWAPEDTTWLAAQIGWGGTALSGFSEDGGENWKRFVMQGVGDTGPSQPGGKLCVTGVGKVVRYRGNNGMLERTIDSGVTWNQCSLGGVPMDYLQNGVWENRNVIASCKERTGYLGLVVSLSGDREAGEPNNDKFGLWLNTNHGADDAWVQKQAGASWAGPGDNALFHNARLRAVPGHAGWWMYTHGLDYDGPVSLSIDDMATWNTMRYPEVLRVSDFDFGPPVPGSSYPTLWLLARVGGVEGLHVSYDLMATTPTLIKSLSEFVTAPFPIGGDRNDSRLLYTGLGGGGSLRFERKDIRALV